MFIRLFLLFTIIPFVELIILLKLGELIGLEMTILMIIVSGILGAYFVKREGLSIWKRLQNELKNGVMPSDEIFNGVLLLIAGIVLITPGLLTDITGYILIIPYTRDLLKKHIANQFKGQVVTTVNGTTYSSGTSGSSQYRGNAETTDYETIE